MPLFIFGTFLITASIVTVFISVIIQKRKQVNSRLQRQKLEFEYSQSLLNTKIEVQETTLNMVAQELHDNVVQALTGCFMQVSAMERYIRNEPGIKAVKHAAAELGNVIRDVRLLSHSLASGLNEERELYDAIQAELIRIETFSGVKCVLRSDTIHELVVEQRLLLFRIVQEGLQNILKHAKAKNITVSIDSDNSTYHLRLQDDGQGFDISSMKNGASLGLSSMKDRIAMLRGQLDIISERGKGTLLDIRIPINLPQ